MSKLKDEIHAAQREYLQIRYPDDAGDLATPKRPRRRLRLALAAAAAIVVVAGVVWNLHEPSRPQAHPRSARTLLFHRVAIPTLSIRSVPGVSVHQTPPLARISVPRVTPRRVPQLRFRSHRDDPSTQSMENSS